MHTTRPLASPGDNMGDNAMNGNSYSTSLQQTGFSSDNAHPRTLYVGNLDPSITEDFIHSLFAPYGRISGLKLISDNMTDPYCFVEFEDNTSAANAILTMNKRVCLDREIKVNWATNPSYSGPKQDTSKHFHIFVGDLSQEIESQQLRDAFSPFGEITDCRVVRDPHTMKSKGYGFVSYLKKQDAECAIANMNNQWLGSRAIRTNWAQRKLPSGGGGGSVGSGTQPKNDAQIGPNITSNRHLNFEDVYSQTSPTNCTVYCGGIFNGLCEDIIHKAFIRFGPIHEVRVFKDKGYAFIKFASKEAATNAIVTMHYQEVLGQTVKCSWGKESADSDRLTAQITQAMPAAAPSLIYPYPNQQVPYNAWYPQGFPGQPFAVPQSTGVQYQPFPAGQFYGIPAGVQSNAGGPYSHPVLAHGWQNSNSSTSLQNVPSHLPVSINSAIQQSAVMGAYPMQGYQAQ